MSAAAAVCAPEFASEAESITREQESIYADLRAAKERGVAAADLDSAAGRFDAVEERVEQLRKRFYPSAARLTIGLGLAVISSAAARRNRIVWVEAREDQT